MRRISNEVFFIEFALENAKAFRIFAPKLQLDVRHILYQAKIAALFQIELPRPTSEMTVKFFVPANFARHNEREIDCRAAQSIARHPVDQALEANAAYQTAKQTRGATQTISPLQPMTKTPTSQKITTN